MIRFEPLLSPATASTLCIASGQFLREPSVAWVRADPWSQSRVEGSSCGPPFSGLRAALGEFEERAFFQREKLAQPTSRRPFRTSGHFLEKAFLDAFRMIAKRSHSGIPDLDTPVTWVRAYSLSNGLPTEVPEIFLSLRLEHRDREWLHLSDSIGCAGHTCPQASLRSSLREFAERQAMILSWLTGSGRSSWEINPEVITDPRVKWIWDTLSAMGRIRIYDLSPWESIYAPLALYDDEQGQPVRFSVSASAHEDPMKALNKTLLELWQSYHFIYSRTQGGFGAKDIFQKQFLEANHPKTADQFLISLREDLPSCKPEDLPSGPSPEEGLVPELLRLSPNLTVFWGTGGESVSPTVYSKVMNPDYFLHMWIPTTNLGNLFHRSTDRPTNLACTQTALPFP